MIYKVSLYDSQTKKTRIICTLPERRKDPKRPKGRATINNWLKSIYGPEWFIKYSNFIGIIGE